MHVRDCQPILAITLATIMAGAKQTRRAHSLPFKAFPHDSIAQRTATGTVLTARTAKNDVYYL